MLVGLCWPYHVSQRKGNGVIVGALLFAQGV
jgi:hypothetical protein